MCLSSRPNYYLIPILVVVALSGGVDSSVTAALLAKKVSREIYSYVITNLLQDYDLSAVFMRNWDTRDESGSDVGCEWEKDWEDVQRVCRQIGLPCSMVSIVPAWRDPIHVHLERFFERVLESSFCACIGVLGQWTHTEPGRLLQSAGILDRDLRVLP